MPKLKTHKGMKKRFKISATGKVQHKRSGSSHLMSHKSGKRVRRLRKKSTIHIAAESRRIRTALLEKARMNPDDVHASKLAALAHEHPGSTPSGESPGTGAATPVQPSS
jgi:large subunit ribosomal protein L35